MHEHDLISDVIETVRSLSGGREIRTVEIALGPGANRVEAAQAWDSLTAGTPLAGAHVNWGRQPTFSAVRIAAGSTQATQWSVARTAGPTGS